MTAQYEADQRKYRIVTLLFALLMTANGAVYLMGVHQITLWITHLGYPLYLPKLLGSAKILGAATLLVSRSPRLREWAYAGFTFDFIGAIYSHLAIADWGPAVPPLAVFILMVLSYRYWKKTLIPSPVPSQRLPERVWPFKTSILEVDSCRIAVSEVGQGPVLLFVHTGTWSFLWRELIQRLSTDFRCICFDAPGTGQSDRQPMEKISLESASRVTTAVIEAMNLSDVTLVFHDLGGLSGIAGAARVADRVRGLCALNTFAWAPAPRLVTMLKIFGSPIMREFNVLTQFIPRVSSTSLGVGRHMDGESRRAWMSAMDSQSVRAFHCYMRDARRSKSIHEQLDKALGGAFRSLPLLTVFGEFNDPFGFQTRWKQLFSDARQVVVSKGHHFPMCDDPDLVARSIREFHRDRVCPTPDGKLRESAL